MLPICVQTVYVRHLQEAVAFYVSALGYAVKATYGPCIVQLQTDATTLILQEIASGAEPSLPTTVLAFRTEDIQASMRKVAESGGELLDHSPQPCPVGLFVRFRDPAGVLHELLQFQTVSQARPASSTSNSQG